MKRSSEEEKVYSHTLLSEYDLHLFREGRHLKIHEKLGSHIIQYKKKKGVQFSVWAPTAIKVVVMGDFNNWSQIDHVLYARSDGSGVFEGFIPNLKKGQVYKYGILSDQGEFLEKGDPYARSWEVPPRTASIVWEDSYSWNDDAWMGIRKDKNSLDAPISVYELHFSSWKTHEDGSELSYKEMAEVLPSYIREMGFTHVEFMPMMEYPYSGSWGYQLCGYFAPTSRFGSPEDLKYLIDILHQEQIGVILDWVPSHYPGDAHGLYRFDGSHLYEHADPKQGYHPDWSSYIFNYGRHEVRNFLLSNAHYWFEYFHIDGMRVDAVASMLYLDYSRKEGEWIPNKYGGNENLEAIQFLKELNETLYAEFPDIQTIAEESTSFPMVSRPIDTGGLGFGLKWMMGWMNDTLDYFKKESIYRSYHQNNVTFSLTYAFTENFMLPLSHDEVAHGKGSLLAKMPGDEWQQFANLRLLYGYMFSHPGAKLLFMGAEWGQKEEWKYAKSLDWLELEQPLHAGVHELVKELNKMYTSEPALYTAAYKAEGFEWIDFSDHQNAVISFLRRDKDGKETILTACNFTPEPRQNYLIGVPEGKWELILHTDEDRFGGSNYEVIQTIVSEPIVAHNQSASIVIHLPPLATIHYKRISN